MSDEKKIVMADGTEAPVVEKESVNRAEEKMHEDKTLFLSLLKEMMRPLSILMIF